MFLSEHCKFFSIEAKSQMSEKNAPMKILFYSKTIIFTFEISPSSYIFYT